MTPDPSKPSEYRCEIKYDGTLCNLHLAHNLITGEIAEGETEETFDKLLPVKKGDVVTINAHSATAARQQEPDDCFHAGVCEHCDHEHLEQCTRENCPDDYFSLTEHDAAIREDERMRMLDTLHTSLSARIVELKSWIKIAEINKQKKRKCELLGVLGENQAMITYIESLRATTPAPGNRDYQCGDNCHGECSGEYDGKIHCPDTELKKKDGE